MANYISLSKELQEKIKNETSDKHILSDDAIRRNPDHDKSNLWRPAYVRDIEKILHSPYYNRYTDKTQVFSLYKNDDISRRAYHVQLVSRIARNIGRLLNLNLDLIEAIALGHDLGHTPFGHAGESLLNELYNANTGRYFNHNVHSVRVLDGIFNHNISLQVLDGILCHNGEIELEKYIPAPLSDFEDFDKKVEKCYTDKNHSLTLISSTLEGCVVRISDIIAYIGKDRQDAMKTGLIDDDEMFKSSAIGKFNALMINNLIVNIVENSYGKDYIMIDREYFDSLTESKKANYEVIYKNKAISDVKMNVLAPMFEKIYIKLLNDLKQRNFASPIFIHHIDFVHDVGKYYLKNNYDATEPNQIVVDYIASMTDDYFVELYDYLFPGSKSIEYVSYFNDMK